MSRYPTLILGVEPRVTVSVARSLHRSGVTVDVASLGAGDPELRSRSIRDFIRVPPLAQSSPDFGAALAALVADRGYDTLMPVTDMALSAVSRHDALVRPLLRLACPPPQAVQRVLNKSLTLEIARGCGIPVPRSFRASDLSELKKLAGQLEFPVIAKPSQKSSNAAAFKVEYFETIADLERAFESDLRGSRHLIQEYCPGDGVGVAMLIHRGEAMATFQHRRLKEFPHTGGVAVIAIAEPPDPQLSEYALKLLRAIQWEGVAMVEFRVNRADGRVALMEVNGRYWGSLSLPIQAGIDFPLYQWRLLHDEQPAVPDRYAVGMRWRWSAGYISSWHGWLLGSSARSGRRAAPRRLFPSLRDLSPTTRDSLWQFSDPAPAIAELTRTLRALIGADIHAVAKRIRRLRHKDSKSNPALLRKTE